MKRERDDSGRRIRRTRPCDFCSEPPGAQHATNCIFGENGRLPVHGKRIDHDSSGEMIVSDADGGNAAAISMGLDIIICTPRQAEAIIQVEGEGPRIAEAIEHARRKESWSKIV